jgi:hypothetical protein
VSAIGMMAGRATVKPGSKPVFPSASKTTMSPAREAATGSQFKQPGLGAKADGVSAAGKTCFKCHSAEHLFKDCPLRGAVGKPALRQFSGAKSAVHQPARVSACNANTLGEDRSISGGLMEGSAGGKGVTGPGEACTDGVGLSQSDLSAESVDFQARTSDDAWVAEVTGSVAGKVTDCGRSEARSGRCFELAPLNFVRIRIKGTDTPSVASLVDSGSELNVIRSDLVSELPLESIGEVSLKGVVGKPVNASLVRLCVRLDDDVLSAVDDIVLIFAVCSELNETCVFFQYRQSIV